MRRKHQIATQYTFTPYSDNGRQGGFCKEQTHEIGAQNKAKLKLY